MLYSPTTTTGHGNINIHPIGLQEGHKALSDRFKPLQPAKLIAVEEKTVRGIDVPNSTPSGNKEQWMAAAGINPADYGYVDFIISHESGWNPCAYNPGKSDCSAKPTTACGLVQALPCSKLGANWTDPVNALRWGDTYAKSRYGSWASAVRFWQSNRWW